MPCIYTGAYVFFPEYGFAVPTDLFRVGNTIVMRWLPDGRCWDNDGPWPREVTHTVVIGMAGWHREDLGVTVVHEDSIVGDLSS